MDGPVQLVSHAYYRIKCAAVLVLQQSIATSTAFRMNTAMCSPLPNERVSWRIICGDWLKRKFCDLAFHRRRNFPTGSSASQPIGAAAGHLCERARYRVWDPILLYF